MLGRLTLLSLAFAATGLGGCVSNRRCRPCCDSPEVVVVPTDGTAVAVESPEAVAARRATAIRMMDEARARTAYLPMKSEDEARKSMPSMEDFPVVPNLIRIAAVMPKTMEAEMEAWDALRREGTVDKRLLSDVFYVVSKSNECGHCMGHIVFSAGLRETGAAKKPIEKVLDIDAESSLDPRRRATFAFARKVSRDPHSVGPADIESLRPFFKDKQIVELILVINRYRTMNTLAEAFGSPLETINVFDPKNAKPKPDAKGTGGAKPGESKSEDPKADGRKPDAKSDAASGATPAPVADPAPAPSPAPEEPPMPSK